MSNKLVKVDRRCVNAERWIQAEAVARHFAAPTAGAVSITPPPSITALVIVVRDRLAGGVTRASGADPHGKTLSSHLFDLRLPD